MTGFFATAGLEAGRCVSVTTAAAGAWVAGLSVGREGPERAGTWALGASADAAALGIAEGDGVAS